jgi:hypothetical protein
MILSALNPFLRSLSVDALQKYGSSSDFKKLVFGCPKEVKSPFVFEMV